jgi:hypothetical protein
MPKMQLGWHFCALDKHDRPVMRDGTLLHLGILYEFTGPLVVCSQGYHDSERVIDALKYAPGPFLCRVLSSGDIGGGDKRVSRFRMAIAGANVERALHEFSAKIAYCALLAERESGREPDPRSWAAVRTKLAWLDGQISGAELGAVRTAYAAAAAAAAAWDAAGSAAGSAAYAAAAAWDAAGSAAGSAAAAAAWDAAGSAAYAAAAAAWDAAGSAAGSAAYAAAAAAAWDAARAAAWDAADRLLVQLLPTWLEAPRF